MSTSSQRTSTSFPLPSSPHCAPTESWSEMDGRDVLTDDSDASGWQLYSSVHLLAADGYERNEHNIYLIRANFQRLLGGLGDQPH
jgi:hypothetical protein